MASYHAGAATANSPRGIQPLYKEFRMANSQPSAGSVTATPVTLDDLNKTEAQVAFYCFGFQVYP
jgi:hypothetical protein